MRNDSAVEHNFRATMRKFPATVTVVTANDGTRDHGMTVTAVTSVSMDPPSLVVCLNQQTLVHEMLAVKPVFAVNVLSHEQRDISDSFSGKVGPDERFTAFDWERHESGVLMLCGAHSRVVCQSVSTLPSGTHSLFIGEVIYADVDDNTRPLLYENAQYCISHPIM